MDYVKGFAGSFKRRILGPDDDDAAEKANDLNHAHSPELPPYPWGSTNDLPEPSTAPVDPYEGHHLSNSSQSRLQHQTDYGKRRPSDATKAPNPANGYQGPPASMKKPDAGMGVQRINTLNGPLALSTNPAHVRKKTTTYSTLDRNTKSIGLQRHGGQQAWLERNPRHKTAASATRNVSSARPLKRRRTEKPDATPRHTIELVDSDVDEIQSPQGTPPPRQRSNFLSRSPHSTTSRHSSRSTNRASQPASEFLTIADSIAPKRVKPPRRKGPSGHDASHRASQTELLLGGAGSQTQEEQFAIFEDNKKSARSSRSQILQNHEQGVRDRLSDNEMQISTGLTSKHFPLSNPQMRINESTKAESTAKEDDNRATGKLRHFRHAEQASGVQNDPILSSGDELSQTDAPEPESGKSPAKGITVKKATAKRRSTLGRSYQLDYARSYEFGPERGDFSLEQTDNKIFRIDGHDSDGKVAPLKMLDLTHVTQVQSDNVRNMRLLGPIKDGNRYWCDLTFTKPIGFNEFRSQFVYPEVVKQSIHNRDVMQRMFNMPLKMNNKIGTMPMINEKTSFEQTSSEQRRTSRNGLISGLTTSSKESNNATSVSTQPLARAARVTRATAPIYNREVIDEEEPNRYSKNPGLGKRWAKPLDYSVDSGFLKRRKATIEYDDLEKLDEGQMLNDSIMTFYMLYLFEKLKVSIDQVYFFNTHFFPTLTKRVKGQDGINYEGVRSWTKRDDVFSYDYLVVPMHEDLHWYLGIICNVNNIKRKPEHEPLQEDSQDLDHSPASLRASEIPTAASNDIDSGKPNETNAATFVLDNAVDTKDDNNDDVYLLQEEKELDLIDPNAETVDGLEHNLSERTVGGDVGMVAPLPAAPTEPSSKLASGKVKQASKKKRDHKLPARDPDKPVIMMLDSLGQTRTVATRALRQWLEAEGKDKRGLEVQIDNRGFYPKGTQIPTQANYSDCGLYVLGYLRKFFTNPNEFTKKLIRFEMSAESDWPDMDPSRMREEIRNLIFEMNEARNGARKEAHKAKKQSGSGHASTSPTNAGAEEVSPAVKQPITAETQNAAAADAVVEVPTSAAATGKIVTPPTDAPRLGSPFRPGSSYAEDNLASTDAVHKDNSARAPTTAQGLQNLFKTTIARQRQSPAKRANSPQVRVPAMSPHDLSTYTLFDNASDSSIQPTQQPADLGSPLQGRDLHGKSDGKLRMPSVESGRVSSPSKPSRERLAPSSLSQARTRSGSHDDPIPVDDSQDLDVTIRKQAQSARKPSPEVVVLDRSQESVRVPARRVQRHAQSSPIRQREARRQVFDRDDSIREVDGREWEERHDPDILRAIETSLENEREQLACVADQRPQVTDDSMEDVFDARAAYSPFSHAVNEVQETQDSLTMEVDNDDQVIPESPAQRRSSPSSDIMMMD